MVGGKVNKKRKEQGSPEKVVQKKTMEVAAWCSPSKDATPMGLDISQQLILELQVIHCTLCAIHMTLKEVSSQIDPDWLEKEKEKKESSLEEGEEERSEKELEEKGEERPVEEMTLDEEVMELEEEAKGKAKEY